MTRLRQPLALLGVLSLLIGLTAPLSALCAQPATPVAPPCHEQVEGAASHDMPMTQRGGPADTHTEGDQPCCLIGPCCLRAVATVVHMEIDRASIPAAPLVVSVVAEFPPIERSPRVRRVEWRPPGHASPIYLALGQLII